jgi:RNA polymerase sigma-70 factor, ECF subfamily
LANLVGLLAAPGRPRISSPKCGGPTARTWSIVVTSRIRLDQNNSARSRRGCAYDTRTIEFVGEPASHAHPVNPANRFTLDDEVRTALLVVLERLTTAERVVFVLHDIFQTPFDSIAETGRPAGGHLPPARPSRPPEDPGRGPGGR